uniref:Uncharacterized protein n=1 Tax=Rhizophora mucronata TaxID=61149 RepID=A0A2P2PXJ1_RHIMU
MLQSFSFVSNRLILDTLVVSLKMAYHCQSHFLFVLFRK